jgi:hypothetical protein
LAIHPSPDLCHDLRITRLLLPAQKGGGDIAAGMAPLIVGQQMGVNAKMPVPAPETTALQMPHGEGEDLV